MKNPISFNSKNFKEDEKSICFVHCLVYRLVAVNSSIYNQTDSKRI